MGIVFASRLQDPQFDNQLGLLFVWSFTCSSHAWVSSAFSGFLPPSNPVDVCTVMLCNGLAFHAGYISTLCPVFLGSPLDPT